MWCGWRDLNPHALRRQNLNLVRLPISPHPHVQRTNADDRLLTKANRDGERKKMRDIKPLVFYGGDNLEAGYEGYTPMKPKTAGCDDEATHQTSTDSFEHCSTWTDPDTFGLVRGSQIITMDGLRCVEDLKAGDRLVTRGQGSTPIGSIRQISLVCRAVYVIAGSLGHGRPDRDGLLPFDQTVLVRDWRAQALVGSQIALIPARDLVDGEFVRDIGQMPMTLYQIHCDGPKVIYVDGMELGTIDTKRHFAL